MKRRFEEGETRETFNTSLVGTNVFRLVTRDGTESFVQLVGLADEPRGVKVRYKLLKQTSGDESKLSHQRLTERWDAAGAIGNNTERDLAFARLAIDAAKAGEVDLVQSSLQRLIDNNTRNQAALDSTRALARRHLRKDAIEIAKRITNTQMRDQALSELAQ